MAELLQHDITTEKEPQLPGGGWISNEETEVQRKSDLPRSQFLPAHPWPNHVPGAPLGGPDMLAWMAFPKKQEMKGVLLHPGSLWGAFSVPFPALPLCTVQRQVTKW